MYIVVVARRGCVYSRALSVVPNEAAEKVEAPRGVRGNDWQWRPMSASAKCFAAEPCWQCHVFQRLQSDVRDGPWDKKPLDCGTRTKIHLAVFTEPYLQYMLDGTKTVESRFSIKGCAPYGRVSPNDTLLLKKAGGPIVAVCEIGAVWFYRLKPATLGAIRRRFSKALCADEPAFWEDRKHATFATLMTVKNLRKIDPICCGKRDRRGWVVLTRCQQRELFCEV